MWGDGGLGAAHLIGEVEEGAVPVDGDADFGERTSLDGSATIWRDASNGISSTGWNEGFPKCPRFAGRPCFSPRASP